MEIQTRPDNVMRGVILLIAVVVIGTLGFMVLEGFAFLDALYMTIITISTVGYGEVRQLHTDGHVFVIVLIIAGIMVVGYTLTSLGRAVVEGSLQRFVGRKRMMREIATMQGHIIVCGYGRVGRTVCEELLTEKVPFVVIERDLDQAEALAARQIRVVVGDATEDEILEQAGIYKARGLVAVAARDVDNLYITLSAREMCGHENPGLLIVARASDAKESRKLRSVGADRVISPYNIGGVRIAQALMRPATYEVIDLLSSSGGMELSLEDVTVREESRLHDRALRETDLRRSFNLMIIGIKKPAGNLVFNPGPEHVLQAGDEIITLGSRDQIDRFIESL